MKTLSPFSLGNFLVKSLVFLILFSSCKKDGIELNYTESGVGSNIKLRSIFFLNENTGFVCGGEQNQSGIILKTIDGGQNWQQVAGYSLSLRDISFVNNSLGFACGDSVLIVKTTDGGQTWNKLELPYTPVHIVPFTSIQFRDEQHGYVCGGVNWDRGLALRTFDAGGWWEQQLFYNTQVNANFYISDTTGFLAAYGAVYKTTADDEVIDLLDIEGDFFTSVYFTSADEGFVCGNDGSIFKTTDGGITWKQTRKDNSAFSDRTHFNKIVFADNGKGFAVGNNGAVFYSDNSGESWSQSTNFPDNDIYSVCIVNGNTAFMCAEGGKVYKISF